MLLAELGKRRPRKAGEAVLEYSPEVSSAFREKDLIVLPERGDLQLYKLEKDWRQFIARLDYSMVWFGGTDENSFLVRISNRPFSEYCRRGPVGFYQSLVPELPGRTYKRQGDIFASPIPYTWEDVLKAFKFIHGWVRSTVASQPNEAGRGLFGTRHHLEGVTLETSTRIEGMEDFVVLAEGTVKAPDHTDMKLEGVHALHQTRHLHDSRNAD